MDIMLKVVKNCQNTVKSKEKGHTKIEKFETFYWPDSKNMVNYKYTDE